MFKNLLELRIFNMKKWILYTKNKCVVEIKNLIFER